jgi:methionyl aminopeptidase
MVFLKSLDEIKKLKKSNRMVGEVLSLLREKVKPGVTTLELNKLAEEYVYDNKAIPAFKGYKGFPYSICASVNSEVIHGFPSKKHLHKKDILSIDFGVLLDGYYGDSAITIPVGKINKNIKTLVRVGQECLYKGIKQAREGSRLNQISYAIQQHAESYGYGVVRQFVGHGIGRNLHEDPQIYNFTNKPTEGLLLKRGMVIAIEPMVTEGDYHTITGSDGWSVRTVDNKLAVHWEHTIAITKAGPEILSLREDETITE